MHNGPATSTDSPLCLNLISFEVVQGETWAERKSPIPMKKKKNYKKSTYIHAGKKFSEGCLAILQAVCALGGTRSELA